MISLLLSLVVFALICWLVWFILTKIPVPAPFVWVVQVIFAIFVIIGLISLLEGGWRIPLAVPMR